LGGAAVVAHAIEALRGDDLRQRERAAGVLARHGDSRLSTVLGEALLTADNTARSAERIAVALAELGGQRAEALLLDALYTHQGAARLGVISGLAAFESLNTIAPLIVLLGHPDGDLRQTVRRTLHAIGAAAVTPLVETLTREMHWLNTQMSAEPRFATLVEQTAQVYLAQRLRHPRWSLHFSVAWQRTAEILRLIGACGAALPHGEQRRYFEVLAGYLEFSRYWDYALTGIAHLSLPEATATLQAMITKREGPRGARAAALLAQHTPNPLAHMHPLTTSAAGRANLTNALAHLPPAEREHLRALLAE
jgi:HEAT repeat protein